MARNKDDDFDGYRKWLGIPETKRPPTHYQLLAVSLDEDDPEVIRAAAEQRRQYVGSKRGEGHDAAVTEIVYRINEAEATLLNQEMRRDYDRQMKLFEKRRKKRQVDPFATRSDVSSPSRMVAGEDTGIVKTFAGIMAVIVVGFGVMAWFSFSLPWSKPAQQVEAAVQPPAPLAAPVQIAQLPEKAPVVEPRPKQVIPQPVETPPAEPVKPKIEDENPAELIAITELSPFTGFGISDDGLTIYFDKKGGEIWSAHRKSVEARFANEKSMQLNGRQPTLSADELEIIFLSERSDRKKGESFYVAKRDAKDGPFRRPAEITELLDKSGITTYKNAFLCANGRELTFNTYTGDTSSLQTTIRPTRKARWSRPVSLPHGVDQHSNLTWPFVSANGCLLLCFEAQDKQNRLTSWHRNSIEEPFAFRRAVSLPGTDTISGRCPRYVAATDELFFLRFIEPFVFQLSCIRNFTSALPIAAHLRRKGVEGEQVTMSGRMKAIQGEWLTIAGEENGETQEKSIVKRENRRLSIKGNSLTMQKVKDGSVVTYVGRFELGAENSHFDWVGKGPQGADLEWVGIYELDENLLKLCWCNHRIEKLERPKSFKTQQKYFSYTLKRDDE